MACKLIQFSSIYLQYIVPNHNRQFPEGKDPSITQRKPQQSKQSYDIQQQWKEKQE